MSSVDLAKVNGVDESANVAAIPALTKTITITGGAANLAAGTHSVLLSGVVDAAGNKSSVLTGSVVVSTDTAAPTVSKVEQVADRQLKVTFDKAVTLVGTGNFVVKKNGYNLGVVASTTDNKTYTLTLSDASPVTVYDAGLDTSGVSLVVSGFKATSNDTVGNAYTTSLTLSKDKTAPTVVSRFNTITDTDATVTVDEAFDIHFNEEITLVGAPSNVTLTDKNGVRQTVSGVSVVNNAAGEAKVLRIESSAVQDVAGAILTGNYNINLPAGFVKDASNNNVAATNVSFTKSASATTVSATATAAANTITVAYGETMSTSATIAANYQLDGKALPAGTNIYFDTNTQTVKIVLPAGTVKSTGGAVLTISDSVVSTNGHKLATAAKTQNITTGFVDNVKPALVSAKKTSGTTIELTFSEAISDASIAALAADNDFEVKVNGVAFTYTTSTGATANDNKLVLTTAAYNTAQTVTVKVTDVAGDVSVSDGANLIELGTAVTASN
ncbi:hypothetical protein [Fictibacillus phosphorivorans]|uniref:hypothetical protein n=1 Tax=Fictibacillus phosphorivorans TaxID=1221500 RepID=UPI001293D2C3|nr:hypothetical protein [Fictibacillus phosphorivorans]MQR94778.1 hypothetical protein [Fictibacillus phosphorivorans]